MCARVRDLPEYVILDPGRLPARIGVAFGPPAAASDRARDQERRRRSDMCRMTRKPARTAPAGIVKRSGATPAGIVKRSGAAAPAG